MNLFSERLGVRPNGLEAWVEGTPRPSERVSVRGVEGASVIGGVGMVVTISDCSSGIGRDLNTCL